MNAWILKVSAYGLPPISLSAYSWQRADASFAVHEERDLCLRLHQNANIGQITQKIRPYAMASDTWSLLAALTT